MSGPLPVELPQHPDKHSAEHPILLAVDQETDAFQQEIIPRPLTLPASAASNKANRSRCSGRRERRDHSSSEVDQ
jgi:hypothetical protein